MDVATIRLELLPEPYWDVFGADQLPEKKGETNLDGK
jgi:hypothetical protein